MFTIKSIENRNGLPLEGKRMKMEPRTYSGKRNDRNRSRRKVSSDAPTSPSKRERHTGPPVLILDNGAHSLKIGMSTDSNPSIIPNCIMKVKSERKRFFIGNQIEECRDLSGLYYLLPCEKGYVMRWTVQKPVWDYMFNNIYPVEDKPVILTQPMFNFKAIQEITDEIFFEEYEIKSLFRVNPTDLAKYQYVNNVIKKITPCIVIDCGYSFTNIVPYIGGKKFYKAVTRINVGGKLLTNYLKDIISYRQLHVMDETYVINQVKEDTCYVSSNFNEDMKIAKLPGNKNTIVRNYVLPDFNNIRRGFIQEDNNIAEGLQILRLNNERFTVPEILFHPSDIGTDSMGIAEAVVNSILLCPLKDQPSLAKNIIIIGGCVNFPGFKERILSDVRSRLPDHWTVNVYKPDNPNTFAWEGGKSLVDDPKCKSLLITKEQYEEQGSSYTYEHFSDWLHTQTSLDEDSEKLGESLQRKSVLQSTNFTRFELFGKYEPETDESLTADEEAIESDPANEAIKNDNSSNADSSKDIEIETSSRRDSSVETHINDGEDLTNKQSVKNLKIIVDIEENSEDTDQANLLSSYDFNVLNNSYI